MRINYLITSRSSFGDEIRKRCRL